MELNIGFSNSFFEEEVRCEYLVSKKLKKVWAVEIDLMAELLRICNKYDITVYAFAGTLLGAIRHKGFIPWDDDIDVCMLRDDYEKLLKVEANEFKHPYFFQTALSDRRFFCEYARLRNSETTGLISYNNSADYNNGIYIDIFVLDGYVQDKKKLKLQLMHRKLVTVMLNSYYHKRGQYAGIKKYAMWAVQKVVKMLFTYEELVKRYNKVISKYTNNSLQVSLMTHSIDFIEKYWCSIEDLSEIEYMPFENIKVPVPSGYDVILKHMYGNYMEFPPIEKRGIWHNEVLFLEPDLPYKEYIKNGLL
ncbi:MAG: LicD family protein [Lachnospiraceae bacterium]